MRQRRWQSTWLQELDEIQLYHCISYVVNREGVLGAEEKEKFREFLRIYEQFSGCRVLTYVLMNEHFHLVLEVPTMPKEGISDEELLRRVTVLYGQEYAEALRVELETARQGAHQMASGSAAADGEQNNGLDADAAVKRIHERFTYRMCSLSEFMKGLMQRYTQWHNRRHERRGHLWEDRFKSVIVESGKPARTLAAYINLNPVRSGYVKQPEEYRWSSYGEAIADGWTKNGSIAQAGLVRAWGAREELSMDAQLELWKSKVAPAFRRMMVEVDEETKEQDKQTKKKLAVKANDLNAIEAVHGSNPAVDASENTPENSSEADSEQESGNETDHDVETIGGIPFARVLRLRIRYFTDGMVIGTKAFLEEAFQAGRERFGASRKSGAREFRGNGAPLSGEVWSMRNFLSGIE